MITINTRIHDVARITLTKARKHPATNEYCPAFEVMDIIITTTTGEEYTIQVFSPKEVQMIDNYSPKPVVKTESICSGCADTLPCGHGTEINDEGRCVLCGGDGQ